MPRCVAAVSSRWCASSSTSAAIRREHRRLLEVALGAPHGEIARQEVVVHHHHVRVGGAAPRLEDEAPVEVRTAQPGAQVRLGRDLVPHLGAGRERQIRDAAVRRVRRPRREAFQLVAAVRLEEGADAPLRLLQPREADVVAPPLEQRVAHRAVLGAERARQQRQVLPDQLLLQVDRVGRDDGALAVHHGPPDRRHEVGEALPDPGPGLEHRDRRRRCTRRRCRPPCRAGPGGPRARPARAPRGRRGREQARDGDGIERLGAARLRHLDDDVERRRPGCPRSRSRCRRRAGAPRRRDRRSRARAARSDGCAAPSARGTRRPAAPAPRPRCRAPPAPRAAPCRRRRRRRRTTPRGRRRRGDRRGDGGSGPRRRAAAASAHVLSSRFRAAGKSTLLRMSR